jgi:hypothetical protein
MPTSRISIISTVFSGQLKLIMKIGLPLDALDPGFHCVRTRWIRGFMAFQLVRRTRSVMLTVPAWPEFGIRDGAARLRPLALRRLAVDSSSPNP